MHLYLDTADRAAAEPLLATGLFHGVTTNPAILRAASLGVADVPGIYRWAVAACAHLAAGGVPTLLTAVHSPGQAVIAAAAGAAYVAPYLGKLQDAGRDGLAAVTAMQEILAGSHTKVLLASIRDTEAVVAMARRGVTHFTVKPAVAEQFFTDDLTAAAVRAFEEDVLATSR